MKKKISLLCVLFLVLVSLNAQTYYYYKGQKINLTVNRDYVNIIADDEFIKSASSDRLFQQFNMEQDNSKQIKNMPSFSEASRFGALKANF